LVVPTVSVIELSHMLAVPDAAATLTSTVPVVPAGIDSGMLSELAAVVAYARRLLLRGGESRGRRQGGRRVGGARAPWRARRPGARRCGIARGPRAHAHQPPSPLGTLLSTLEMASQWADAPLKDTARL
jgi:hypothetical protein